MRSEKSPSPTATQIIGGSRSIGPEERILRVTADSGESPSTIKDTALSAVANIAAMGHSMASDEILKNTFSNEAFEHYEIAAYKSLLRLCEEAGQLSAAQPLRQSLQEEQRMAAWIGSHLEKVTLDYLAKREREKAA